MALSSESISATLKMSEFDLGGDGAAFAELIDHGSSLDIDPHVDILTASGQFLSRPLTRSAAVEQLVSESALIGRVIYFDAASSLEQADIEQSEFYDDGNDEVIKLLPDRGQVVGMKWNLSAEGGSIDFGSFSSLKSAEQARQVIATALRISGMAFKGQEANAMHAQEAAPDRLRASLEVLNYRLDHSHETLATLPPKSTMRL